MLSRPLRFWRKNLRMYIRMYYISSHTLTRIRMKGSGKDRPFSENSISFLNKFPSTTARWMRKFRICVTKFQKIFYKNCSPTYVLYIPYISIICEREKFNGKMLYVCVLRIHDKLPTQSAHIVDPGIVLVQQWSIPIKRVSLWRLVSFMFWSKQFARNSTIMDTS